jgi:hypothetical protein
MNRSVEKSRKRYNIVVENNKSKVNSNKPMRNADYKAKGLYFRVTMY